MFDLRIFLFLTWAITRSQEVPDGLQNRIVGGQEINIRGYPFTTAINVETSNSRHFCGGALFGQEWIITAGQCVDGAVLFTISLGSSALEGEDSNRVTLTSSTYYLHPEYNSQTLDNDIGLIKLPSPVTNTMYTRTFTYIGQVTMGVDISTIGWGQTSDSNSSLSNTLRLVYFQPITNEECKITYGNQITDNMICVVGNNNEGICHGDTGGPLIELSQTGFRGLVGIASFLSGHGCESIHPSGFTRTYPYVDWIRDVTGKEIITSSP